MHQACVVLFGHSPTTDHALPPAAARTVGTIIVDTKRERMFM